MVTRTRTETSLRNSLRNVWTLLFLLLGAVFIACSALPSLEKHQTAKDIAFNFGVVLVAVVLVEFLWRLVGGSPIDNQITSLSTQIRRLSVSIGIVERAREIGLENAYKRQGDFGNQETWERLIGSATAAVDVMGRTAHGWTKSRATADLIVAKITNDNVAFRWLVMSDDNVFLPLLKEGDEEIGEDLKRKLRDVRKLFQNIRSRIPSELHHRLQIKAYSDTPLYCAFIRIDDRCFVTQYLSSRNSYDSPLLEFRGADASWPRAFREEFEAIWASGTELLHERPDSALAVGRDGS